MCETKDPFSLGLKEMTQCTGNRAHLMQYYQGGVVPDSNCSVPQGKQGCASKAQLIHSASLTAKQMAWPLLGHRDCTVLVMWCRDTRTMAALIKESI